MEGQDQESPMAASVPSPEPTEPIQQRQLQHPCGRTLALELVRTSKIWRRVSTLRANASCLRPPAASPRPYHRSGSGIVDSRSFLRNTLTYHVLVRNSQAAMYRTQLSAWLSMINLSSAALTTDSASASPDNNSKNVYNATSPQIVVSAE